jgi:hypothetical protein
MAISVTGRVVKVKPTSQIVASKRKKTDKESLKYNHFYIKFADNSERHFVFTDTQIKAAIIRAKSRLNKLGSATWVKEVWYDGVVDVQRSDIDNVIEKNSLPSLARQINHIRVDIEGEIIHLVFTNDNIRSAISRASKFVKLPRISWLSDKFRKRTQKWETLKVES